MMFSSRSCRMIAMGSLIFALVSFQGGASGLPVGPRAPDAASGSSVDDAVFAHPDEVGIHGGEDGASKYLHVGQDPKPATVTGSPLLETTLKVLVSGDEVFPRPASPGYASQRRLLWFGFGGGHDKKEEYEPQKEAVEKEPQGGPDQQEEKTGEKAAMDEEEKQGDGQETFHEEEDDGLDDAEHMWHGEEHHDDTDEDNGDLDEEEDVEEDDEDDENDEEDEGEIIYTHGEILKVAKNLVNEYQLKSLNMKEELTDVQGREKAAEMLESDIDTEIDLLMKQAGETDETGTAEEDGNGDAEKQEFLERMMGAKKAAKKRVKDILTGHNIHFDKDDL